MTLPPPRPSRFELRTPWSRMGDTSIATAYDTLLQREVTLKRHECDDPQVQRDRTVAEARAMAGTRHAMMLPVHDMTELPGEGFCLVLGTAADRISGPPSIPSPLASMLAPPLQTSNLRRRQSITAALAMVLLVVLYVWTRNGTPTKNEAAAERNAPKSTAHTNALKP